MATGEVIGGKTTRASSPPQSVTNGLINLIGAISAVSAVILLSKSSLGWQTATVICMAATAVPIAVLELLFLKVHLRPSVGMRFGGATAGRGNPGRVAIKLLGLYAVFGVIALVYWVIPEYSRRFYGPFMALAREALPYLVVLAVPYFVYVDRRLKDPHDGYWHLGRMILGIRRQRDRDQLRELALGWIIKAFYLPLMFVYLANVVRWLMANPLDLAFAPFAAAFAWWFKLGLFVDLSFGTIGYVVTVRLLDSHIRTSNPLFHGWFVTVICYAPFWGLIGNRYFQYNDELSWLGWLSGHPAVLVLWGSVILLFMAFWVWANMTFGLRFSNLTHRGILTNGPFRFTKHPSYVSKNIYWWLLSVPFISSQGWDQATQNCLLILGVNAIYFMRARIEEKHLSEDPVYVEYALWIDRHGVFRGLGGLLPWLRYRPPAVPGDDDKPMLSGTGGGNG